MRRSTAAALTATTLATAALVGPAPKDPAPPAQIGTALFIDRTDPAASRSKIRKPVRLHTVKIKPKVVKPKPVRAVSRAVSRPSAPQTPASGVRGLGQAMAAARGWTGHQWVCLDSLVNRESHWSVTAHNASGAYGIPQALPGSKMGPGWQTSATVQIRWMLGYIAGRYGTPCGAWAHSQGTGWY